MRTDCPTGLVLSFPVLGFAAVMLASASAGETLYNGIVLPDEWPPRFQNLTRDKPMPVPYLKSPPEVIPIDVGRQLFVDDFLIEKTTLKRTFHKAEYHPNNPVLKPDRPWEQKANPNNPSGKAAAMVFGDGVWFDPKDNLFKMWYMGGYCLARCYATSKDGIHWEKPSLDVVRGTNIVHPGVGDTAMVWLDLEEKDPKKRFKMFREDTKRGIAIYYSADGVHWSDEIVRSGPVSSPSTVFWNPFRKVWVYSLRGASGELGRYRRYWETADPAGGIQWHRSSMPEVGPRGKGPTRAPLWICSDRLDPPLPGAKHAEIYNLDAVGYESVLLGLFSMLRGHMEGRPKIKEISAGFSRDGFHWHRPFRESIIGVSKSPEAWNAGNIQSAGGCCLVVGDKLYFYVSGRRVSPDDGKTVCTTGLAVVRRDGFASMDAGAREGTLITRPVRFKGKYLFVNVAAETGELRVEVLDKAGRVMPGLSRDDCVAVRVDKTLVRVRWKGVGDLSKLAGRPVRFRFYLTKGRLYAFWVSPDLSGASYGYVAAGGPGFTGPTDTAGLSAYRAAG